MLTLTLTLPETRTPVRAATDEVLLVTNADLRESANTKCWPVQQQFESKLQEVARRPLRQADAARAPAEG